MTTRRINANDFINKTKEVFQEQNQPNTFKESETWLNIGYEVEYTDPETGEVKSTFISLSRGIPLESLSPRVVRTKDRRYAQMIAAGNSLQEQIIDLADSLNPGDNVVISEGLQIQVLKRASKVSDDLASDDDSNPFIRPLELNI